MISVRFAMEGSWSSRLRLTVPFIANSNRFLTEDWYSFFSFSRNCSTGGSFSSRLSSRAASSVK
jgi:hypothetical protein